MQLYIYAKSGHNFGLENVRRCSAIYNMLSEATPILCTADYRAATFAKQELGVKTGLGIDIIGNLPNIMERGDILIFDDSGEASLTMQESMKDFCKLLFKVGVDITFDIVDEMFYKKYEIKNQKTIFFSDDDYANWFFDFCDKSKKYDIPLLLGHYFFLGNEDRLSKSFNEVLEDEEYFDTITTTKYLLTSSVQASLESIASGNKPVFFKRGDKQNQNLDLIDKYNIPIIEANNLDELILKFEEIIKDYPIIKEIEKFNINEIKDSIIKLQKLFESIKPSLEYKY